jgi:PAS domain S-box-containing protein
MPARSLKLLFVEDSPHDAELALAALARHGFEVDSTLVHNHQGVEKALSAGSFDLILSDYLLPGSSGMQALQVARRLAPETPFLFLSGIFGEEHAVEMMRLGAVDYVLKQNIGFLPQAIERAMAEVFERQERRRAEDALQEVELRADLAIEAARLGLWDYQPQTDTLIWDARCKALYGLPSGRQVRDIASFLDACDPADRERLHEQVARALSLDSGDELSAEYRIQVGGAVRWLSIRGRASFEDGRCVRLIGVLQDISEQKQVTLALQELNQTLGERVERRTRERDRTWDLSRELLAVMRFDLTPIALNPAWQETLGWSREEFLQAPLWHLLHPDDLASTRAEAQRIADGYVSTRFVNRLRHADGGYRWMSWTVVPEQSLMYAAVRDITSEREALEELASSNRQLLEQIAERERVEATLQQMQRLEAVGQLTAGVAHDFNNLLTVILASSTFLARDLPATADFDKSRQRLQNIREAGERGAKLTGQLLAFSRRQRLTPEPVNLNDTVRGMLELLKSTLGGSVLIETALADDLRLALVDPTQIELIILNLAINARDAMAVGGTLGLSTRRERVVTPPLGAEDPEPGDYVVLSVSDSGTGMSDEVLAKAFEPFFTTKDVGKGSGLGLAQVFGFAKQSGGGARIDTRLGVGTTVSVYLPCVVDAVADLEPALAESVQGELAGKSCNVLLVDDDPNVRAVTAMLLDDLGYQVIEADSGPQALELLDDDIDILLADFAMPGMNGADVARAVRQRYPRMPVVFITGYAELGGLDVEHTLIVPKPFRGEELAAKLDAALVSAELRASG